jgi:hypothetical protein
VTQRRLRALAGALVACGVQGAAAAGPTAATGPAALPPGLDLPDEALFGGRLDPQLTVRLLNSSFVGVALRAPTRVDIEARNSLPLLVASRFDGARGWSLPFEALAQLVAVETQTGQVRVQAAFGSDKRAEPDMRGPKPSADDLRSFGAQINVVDARARLSLPWQPGCWSLRIVYHDWVSNPVQVQVDRGPSPGPSRGPSSDPSRGVTGSCRAMAAGAAQVSFRLEGGSGSAAPHVRGRVTLPADALGADRSALAATLLAVVHDSATVQRTDWQVPLSPAAGAASVSGTLDQALPARLPPGGLTYLVIAGQLHGPQSAARHRQPPP